MKKISRSIVLAASFATPLLTAAATGVPSGIDPTYITNYSTGIQNVINDILVPVLLAIAFIVFLWGVYKYFILGAADSKSQEEGRAFVMWGVIGFVVILSVWGLINIVGTTLGLPLGGAAPFKPPTL